MSGYGQVLSGGASMRKGLSKDINDKHKSRESEDARREVVATAVNNAYKVNTVSSQHTNNVRNSGKFTKPSVPKNV
jgi:hypothetical protein